MYQAILVEQDIEIGRRILAALDGAKIPVTGSLWLYVPQLGEWHLMIGTPAVDRKGPRGAFMQIWNILAREELLQLAPLRRISLVKSDDPLISALRNAYRRPYPSEFPLTSAYFGNISIEQAYVYRLTPPTR